MLATRALRLTNLCVMAGSGCLIRRLRQPRQGPGANPSQVSCRSSSCVYSTVLLTDFTTNTSRLSFARSRASDFVWFDVVAVWGTQPCQSSQACMWYVHQHCVGYCPGCHQAPKTLSFYILLYIAYSIWFTNVQTRTRLPIYWNDYACTSNRIFTCMIPWNKMHAQYWIADWSC